MEPTVKYDCGCGNVYDRRSGVLRSAVKCEYHRSHAGKSGIAHYVEMGAISNGVPRALNYMKEFTGALTEMQCPLAGFWGGRAFEIGCGVGGYVPWLLQQGYNYTGLDSDLEAADFVRHTYCVDVIGAPFSSWADGPDEEYDLVLAAHVLEHLPEAVEALATIYDKLTRGGRLLGIVPDDEDPVNPDHLWFFNEGSLRGVLERVGFRDVRTCVRRVVKHENFIYFSGVKA